MSNYDPNQPGQPYDPTSGSDASNPNPYGQNPYGQNQPGQAPYGQNPYGQPQSPAPSFDPYGQPQGGYAPVQPPAQRPKTLQWAFLLILLSGIANAIATWFMFNSNMFANMITSQWSLLQEQMRSDLQANPQLAEDPFVEQMLSSPEAFMAEFNSVMSGFMITSAVISIALYFLVGFFVGRGVSAMRIIATVLAVLSLLGLSMSIATVSMFGDAQAGMLNAMIVLATGLGVAGVVFAWLRPSSEYILARRMARRAGYR
ncbi:hypothetical protein [Glutamicibacter protophormiae]|uniref:hypothetical protein n=1 Tax=Glutamicibacter protophormiae TaxID=37930 RepID=UPI003A91DB8E